MPLTSEEKTELHGILTTLFGYDSQLETYKDRYTERSVELTETILESIIQCNSNLKTLVVSLLGGAQLYSKGWLKKILKALGRYIRNEQIKFNGIGCRVVALNNWKSALIISTM